MFPPLAHTGCSASDYKDFALYFWESESDFSSSSSSDFCSFLSLKPAQGALSTACGTTVRSKIRALWKDNLGMNRVLQTKNSLGCTTTFLIHSRFLWMTLATQIWKREVTRSHILQGFVHFKPNMSNEWRRCCVWSKLSTDCREQKGK